MNAALLPTLLPNLDKFLQVYGNKCRRKHFIAMRFKRAIITYTPNTLDSVPIEPPDNSIVVIHGKCPPINVTNQSFLLFTNDAQGIQVSNNSVDTLLRSLFPIHLILHSYFKSDVLYLVASENPFSSFMTKCRRDVAFTALCLFEEARHQRRALTLNEVTHLRFFKRPDRELKHFNRWSPFAFDICNEPCFLTTRSHPSAFLGKEVFSILNRSKLPPSELPPPDFYQCEINLSHDEHLGVSFVISKQRDPNLEYVSSMVVAKPPETFLDSSFVACNSWLPLYRNYEEWNSFGVENYVLGLHYKKNVLKHILSWLQIQTSEKYNFIYRDMAQVARILFGEASRNFLRPDMERAG